MQTISNKIGYHGKILWVNLTSGEFIEEEPSDAIYRSYLGGYGLGVYYIYTRIKPHCDPLSANNILGFCPGLFTGTVAPFTGRWMVCGKSPLTGKGITREGQVCNGGWGDANAGGYFGPAIKRTGYDAIFFTGAAQKPVYLYIYGKTKELKDATDLWGRDTVETEKILKEKHGKGVQIAAIGKGGENLSLISGIVTDGGRIAARSGLGAVMGSKKLKAVCLNGLSKQNFMDSKKASEISIAYRKRIESYFDSMIGDMMVNVAPKMGPLLRMFKIPMKSPENLMAKLMHELGTGMATPIAAESGDMPIKNLKGLGYIDWPQKIARQFGSFEFLNKIKRIYGCFGCPLQCGAILSIPEINLEETHRPEYETLAALGGMILNPDINTLFRANDYLNREGIDTISAGGVLAFVLECVENGILKKEDFKCNDFPEGFLPLWNQSDYILPLLKMMVMREGIGNLLADGVWEASHKIGKNASEFAMAVNGQELPMHDARLMKGLALTYLTDPTPGRHTAGGIDFGEIGPINKFLKGLKFKNAKNDHHKGVCQAQHVQFVQTFNALGLCVFAANLGEYPLFEFLKTLLGWEMSVDEFLEIGHRIQTLRQLFNAREGAIRHEMPKRAIGDPPLTKGPHNGFSIDVEMMAQGYYHAMGFRTDGLPLENTLKHLKLDMSIKDLPNCIGRDKPIINEYLSQKNE